MKYRVGFVSNSSSSSFVCNVCGGVESGYDATLSDCGMNRCVNGHEFHMSCAKINSINELYPDKKQYMIDVINQKAITEWYTIESKAREFDEISDLIDEDRIDDYFREFISEEGLLESHCPICSFKTIDGDDMTKYLLKRSNQVKADVLNEVKDKFKSYKEFQDFIK